MTPGAGRDAIWKALSDPTRRAILDRLATRERTTGELCDWFSSERRGGLARTTVMKHLDVLVDAGLVLIRREGRHRWNLLNPAPLQQVLDAWLSRRTQALARSLNRLRELSEDGR